MKFGPKLPSCHDSAHLTPSLTFISLDSWTWWVDNETGVCLLSRCGFKLGSGLLSLLFTWFGEWTQNL